MEGSVCNIVTVMDVTMFILGIISIVLSIVAIVFTILFYKFSMGATNKIEQSATNIDKQVGTMSSLFEKMYGTSFDMIRKNSEFMQSTLYKSIGKTEISTPPIEKSSEIEISV